MAATDSRSPQSATIGQLPSQLEQSHPHNYFQITIPAKLPPLILFAFCSSPLQAGSFFEAIINCGVTPSYGVLSGGTHCSL
jgi:hypothetical protein